MLKRLKAAVRRSRETARRRRGYRRLLGLDERLLRDAGVTRDQVERRIRGLRQG